VFAGSQIFMIFYKYHESDKIYSNVSNEVLNNSGQVTAIISDNSEDATAIQEIEAFDYNHEKLVSINPDAVGYIYIPSSNTRLPIVQGDDKEYYLSHSFDRTPNSSGCIYEDYRIKDGLSSSHVILNGHHMKNDGMFAPLKYYLNQSYYTTEGNDVFYIYTENRIIQYRIFSVHVDDPETPAYTFNFPTIESMREYALQMKDMSMYDTGVDVHNATQVVTLLTCTATGDGRIIVQGMYVGEGVLNSTSE
ncbi:MAG: class B sortase, partial [Clostridia bacterium]|nr:class B sortase [Clostridia bacterium]